MRNPEFQTEHLNIVQDALSTVQEIVRLKEWLAGVRLQLSSGVETIVSSIFREERSKKLLESEAWILEQIADKLLQLDHGIVDDALGNLGGEELFSVYESLGELRQRIVLPRALGDEIAFVDFVLEFEPRKILSFLFQEILERLQANFLANRLYLRESRSGIAYCAPVSSNRVDKLRLVHSDPRLGVEFASPIALDTHIPGFVAVLPDRRVVNQRLGAPLWLLNNDLAGHAWLAPIERE